MSLFTLLTFFLFGVFLLINLPPFYLLINSLTVYRIAEFIVGILFILTILIAKYRHKYIQIVVKSKVIKIIFFIFAIQSLSIISAKDIRLFLFRYEICLFYILFSLLMALVLNNKNKKKYLNIFLYSFVPSIIIESILFFFPKLAEDFILPHLHSAAYNLIIYNISRNRNYLESFTFFIIPLLIYKILHEKNRYILIFLYIFFVAIFFLSLVSNFRVYIILVIFNIIVTLFFIKWPLYKLRRYFIILFILSFIFIGSIFFIKSTVINRFSTSEENPKDFFTGRPYLWTKAIEIGQAYPILGAGIGNYLYYNTTEISKRQFTQTIHSNQTGSIQVFDDPHDIFLSFFAETGYLGLLVIILTLLFFAYNDLYTLRNNYSNNNENTTLNTIVIIAFWSLICYSLINPINTIRFYLLFSFARIYIDTN